MTRTKLIGAIAAVILTASLAWAGRILLTIIGPTNTTARVTQVAAGAAIRNCMTTVDVTSDAAFTFRILDGGTTVYAVPVSSGGALIRDWSNNPFCGTANTVMELTVSNGNYNINYAGVTAQ